MCRVVVTSSAGARVGAACEVGEAVAQAQSHRSDAVVHARVLDVHLVLDYPPRRQAGVAETTQHLRHICLVRDEEPLFGGERSGSDFIPMYPAMELQSVCFYVPAARKRDGCVVAN